MTKQLQQIAAANKANVAILIAAGQLPDSINRQTLDKAALLAQLAAVRAALEAAEAAAAAL
jgi:hypothetical protein